MSRSRWKWHRSGDDHIRQSFATRDLLRLYNEILTTGQTDDGWHETIFCMIPKSGDLTDASNWRPIAILPILYKIFSRMLYDRLLPLLDAEQSEEQIGFRPGRRIDDAFVILDSIIGKAIEFQVPLWMISLDLRKAFDRVQYTPLFSALRDQGVPESYVSLLRALYRDQRGSVNGSKTFSISRGVKQGDVLSPLLFNAALEAAFRNWKQKLTTHGLLLAAEAERLTNTRYADDCMIFGKSLDEVREMTELLVEELAGLGLTLHSGKSKIFTTVQERPADVVINGEPVAVMKDTEQHRYLGRLLPGNLRSRGRVEIKHRIQAGWAKYSQHARTSVTRKISLKLRLELFDAVVSPCVLFGLGTLPLYVDALTKLEATQRKMLRRIVGWVRDSEEPWASTMSRMKQRMETASSIRPIHGWRDRILSARQKQCERIGNITAHDLPRLAAEWCPTATQDMSIQSTFSRPRGRPRRRWNDDVRHVG